MKHLALLLFILSACTSGVKVDVGRICVRPSSDGAAMKLSEFAASAECIPLETTDSVIINNPVQIILHDGYEPALVMFIIGNDLVQCLFLFLCTLERQLADIFEHAVLLL